jgi:hypothetical protein
MPKNEPAALTSRTRLSKVSRWTARGVLLALIALTVYGLAGTRSHDLLGNTGRGEDIALYTAIVHDLRIGQGYYAATETQLRSRGYAMASIFNWRLPTLAWLFSILPSDRAARGFLGVLSLLTLAAWFAALRRTAPPRAALPICLLLLGLLLWPFVGEAYRVHETWAGIAIALSIAAAVLGWPLTSVIAGMSALAIRELALPYLAVALMFALRDRRRREIIGWCAGLTLFCACYGLHAWAVSHHQLASDRAQAASWFQFGGWWFVLKTGLLNAWLIAAPPWLVALLWPLSLLGLFAWQGSLGSRTAATGLLYVGLFLVVGLPFNYLWGLLYAGLVPLGLYFAPAALRDLVHRAFGAVPR